MRKTLVFAHVPFVRSLCEWKKPCIFSCISPHYFNLDFDYHRVQEPNNRSKYMRKTLVFGQVPFVISLCWMKNHVFSHVILAIIAVSASKIPKMRFAKIDPNT